VFVSLCVLGLLALLLAALGYSWARDPAIRTLAERPGWRLAPPVNEIQGEMDEGRSNPSELRVEIEAVGLVKVRRLMLIAAVVSLLISGVGLLIG
jgi:hypothetical protein